MSPDEHKGSAFAFRELMRIAQRDLDEGRDAPAIVKWKTPNPAKVTIGWFKRRLLRGEFRTRA